MKKEDFAPWLKAFIRKNALTPEQAARVADVHVKTIYDWLKGKGPRRPDQVRLAMLHADQRGNFDEAVEIIPPSERAPYRRIQRELEKESAPVQTRQLKLAIRDLRSHPEWAFVVGRLLQILLYGGGQRRLGIQATIDAFFGDMLRKEIEFLEKMTKAESKRIGMEDSEQDRPVEQPEMAGKRLPDVKVRLGDVGAGSVGKSRKK